MLRFFLLVLVIVTKVVIAQDSNWSSINAGNSDLPNETIKCITFDKAGAMWVGTYMGGLAVRENNNWTIYNTSNSELPHNYINTIAVDNQDVVWIGTDGGGLTRFDGTNWEIYKTSNSGLPSNVVMTVFCDDDGTVWIGTYFGGLARFDGENWKVFNDQNSPLLSNKVVVIKKDNKGNLWFGTQGGGVASFDGANWIIYNERNSKLSSDYIYSIDIDNENNKWIGTGGGGIAVFNDVFWLSYNSENSGLTDDNIRPLYIDVNQEKWIGTYIGGVNIFNDETWRVFDYQNSGLPDDEITCFGNDGTTLLIGTERSGIIVLSEAIIPIAPVITKEPLAVVEQPSVEEVTEEDDTNLGIVAIPVVLAETDKISEPAFNETTEFIAEEVIEENIDPVVIAAVPVAESISHEVTDPALETEDEIEVNEKDDPVYSVVIAVPLAESVSNDQTESNIETEEELVITEDAEENIDPVVVASIPVVIPELNAPEEIPLKEEETEMFVQEETDITPIEQVVIPSTGYVDVSNRNKIVLMFDAADVNIDPKRLNTYKRSFKYLLKNRERINDSYDVTMMIYSSNFDVDPKKIQFSEKEFNDLHLNDIIYLEGESTFTEAITRGYNTILSNYNPDGNNQLIAATYKFIRDDESAKQVIKDNVENNYIMFSLLAFDTESMKMHHKMRNMIPKGQGHYYSINPVGMKDNWSVTAQIGLSAFKGDIDVDRNISFPGVIGFAVNKQVLSTGVINGGLKGQFNFGKLRGEKNGQSFENKYKEGCVNFQVILNKLPGRTFRFEKFRPYAFAGIGFINYRVLLKNKDGSIINGYGYDITEYESGDTPTKSGSVTNMMIPVGMGVNYKISEKFNLELEASSRFIASDKLDAKISNSDDKYWFISVGVSYMINSKEFLSDILSR